MPVKKFSRNYAGELIYEISWNCRLQSGWRSRFQSEPFLRERSATGLSTSETKNAPNMARQPRNGGRGAMRVPLADSTSSAAHQLCLQFEPELRHRETVWYCRVLAEEILFGTWGVFCGDLMRYRLDGEDEMDFVRKWIRILVRVFWWGAPTFRKIQEIILIVVSLPSAQARWSFQNTWNRSKIRRTTRLKIIMYVKNWNSLAWNNSWVISRDVYENEKVDVRKYEEDK